MVSAGNGSASKLEWISLLQDGGPVAFVLLGIALGLKRFLNLEKEREAVSEAKDELIIQLREEITRLRDQEWD